MEGVPVQPHLRVVLFDDLLDGPHLLVENTEHVRMLLGIEFCLLRIFPLDLELFLLSLQFFIFRLDRAVVHHLGNIFLELLIIFE